MNIIKSAIFARLPWIGYIVAYLIINIFRFVPGFYHRKKQSLSKKCCLAIEAGMPGWNSIEFKELYRSSSEYFGRDSVVKVVIDKNNSYISQIESVLNDSKITHYLYDPRTGRQDYFSAFLESVRVAVLLSRYRVVPVVYLTDLSYRIWRCQAAAVSATSGLVVTFIMPKQVQPIFPHRRLLGPSLIPLSIETLDNLQRTRTDIIASNSIQRVVRFTGSLYEPRTSFLRGFKKALDDSGHRVEILGRELGSIRITDDEYWRRLSTAEIVITTADQAVQSGADWTWVRHLVYRYLEVLASGSLLLAPPVPGVSRYFEPGKDFVSFESLEDAIEKARFYLHNPKEAEEIRIAGHKKAAQLIRIHSFWLQIDTALGSESFSA